MALSRLPLVAVPLLLVGAGIASAQSLTLYSEENPPYNYTPEGEPFGGICTEVVAALFDRAGVAYAIEPTAWNRAYHAAQHEADACVFCTNRTEPREPLFDWVGPLSTGGWALFARPDSGMSLSSLEEARDGYSIGTQLGGGFTQYLIEFGGLQLLQVADQERLPAMLHLGRFDLLAGGVMASPYTNRQAGGAPMAMVLSIRESELSLACSPDVDDALITRLNEVLDTMWADGTVDGIVASYR